MCVYVFLLGCSSFGLNSVLGLSGPTVALIFSCLYIIIPVLREAYGVFTSGLH